MWLRARNGFDADLKDQYIKAVGGQEKE